MGGINTTCVAYRRESGPLDSGTAPPTTRRRDKDRVRGRMGMARLGWRGSEGTEAELREEGRDECLKLPAGKKRLA